MRRSMQFRYEGTLKWAWLLLAICAPSVLCARVLAQAADTQDTSKLLKKIVHIEAGSCTIEQVTRMLCEQTGLTIEAENCIQKRIVNVQSAAWASAFDILTSLAELHDWKLEETENPKKVILKRAPVKPARDLQDVSLGMKAAMPKDLRNYLGFGVDVRTLPSPMDAARKDNLEKLGSSDGRLNATLAVRYRVDEKAKQANLRLLDQIPADLVGGGKKKWTTLPESLRDQILLTIVLGSFREMFQRSSGAQAILPQRLFPWQADISKVEISITTDPQGGHTLMFGTTTFVNGRPSSYSGFGSGID